jgi:hypothetical protein
MKPISAISLLLTSFVSADRAAYLDTLMQNAVPSGKNRFLEQQQVDNYQVNIAAYSVRFEQCQFVKAFDEELAQSDESSTVLSTKRFVLFRLCPSGCNSCNYNYGEYLVDLETYLEATVQYFQNYYDQMCQACYECSNNAADDQAQDGQQQQGNNRYLRFLQNYGESVNCDSCTEECQKIENMEAKGYVDATEFVACKLIYGPQDDNRQPLYAGPVCASNGSKINIGVFTDENCLIADTTKDVNDYLSGDNGQMRLGHNLLKNTYTNTCISCKEPADQNKNNQGNDNIDSDAVSEMCETLYSASAKCEKKHGFADGYGSYNGYENQLTQEDSVCSFMQSLKSGTYSEEGDIMVSGASHVAGSDSTTGGQKFALTFFILGTVGLAVYAAMLHSKLVHGKTEVTSRVGAFA